MSMEATLAALDQLQEALRDLIISLQNGQNPGPVEIPKQAPAESEAEKAEAPAKEPETPKTTFEELRTVLVAKSREGKTALVHMLLERFNAESLSEVDPADYTELLEAGKRL